MTCYLPRVQVRQLFYVTYISRIAMVENGSLRRCGDLTYKKT